MNELAGDISSSLRFVDDFLCAWEPRLVRVRAAVEGSETLDVLAVLLSLATSSAMLGAAALNDAALQGYDEVSSTRRLTAASLEQLTLIGEGSCSELRDLAAAWRAKA